MKRVLLLSILSSLSILMSACATLKPTGYVPAVNGGTGYQVKELGKNVYIAIYKGNSRTRVADAISYTMLTGYGYCEKKNQVALVDVPKDFSESQTYTNVSTYSTPIYGQNGSVTYAPHTYSYPVTQTFPQFYSAFVCRGSFKVVKNAPKYEKVSRELVHPITKDFKGGLLVKEVPAGQSVLKESDVIVKVGGIRIENESEMADVLDKAEGGSVKLEMLRGQKVVKKSVEIEDVTDAVQKLRNSMVSFLCKKLEVPQDYGFKAPIYESGPAICPTPSGMESSKEVVSK